MNNGGLLRTNQKGHLNNYGNVCYHPKTISKIRILRNIKKNIHIINDSNNGDRFIVNNTIHGRHNMIFTKNKTDFIIMIWERTKVCLCSVPQHKIEITLRKQQYESLNLAREFYHTVGHTSIKYYKINIKINPIKTFSCHNVRHWNMWKDIRSWYIHIENKESTHF